MVSDYGYSEEDFALALDRVRDGHLYVKKLRDKHFADSSSFIVFLFYRRIKNKPVCLIPDGLTDEILCFQISPSEILFLVNDVGQTERKLSFTAEHIVQNDIVSLTFCVNGAVVQTTQLIPAVIVYINRYMFICHMRSLTLTMAYTQTSDR